MAVTGRWDDLTLDQKANRLREMIDDIVNQQNGVNARLASRITDLENALKRLNINDLQKP